ncbi:metallophosphoesterase [Erysipelothrix anatis]|uniref:metallophosphoesterase n=1 Tax=Erysipelothrix anatis TaxID=2683713 RepID=UPI001356BC3E|nr:metallophosphoesterase [Erysipelothrix anatis]
MGIKIAHLSDFHFSENNLTSHFNKLSSLTTSLKNVGDIEDKLLIIVSGDIAYSGKSTEYTYASNFFQQLRISLKSNFKSVELYFVPGNHDCDFSTSDYLNERSKRIRNLVDKKIPTTDNEVKFVGKVLENYSFFERKNSPYVKNISLLQNRKIVMNKRIQINLFLLNTAWMSSLHENKNIIMPTKYFSFDAYNGEGIIDVYNLFVYHHPRSWFTSNDDHSLREMIETKNGIILTGHEHTDDAHIKRKKENDLLYSVGGTFEGDSSTFKVISIDDDKSITEETYLWSVEYNCFIIETQKHAGLDLTEKNIPRPNEEHISFLEDLGMLITHPRKKAPVLSDLFVNPYLTMSLNKGNNHELRIKDEDAIKTLIEEEKCVIDGDYGSGKTSLAKRLISELINLDKYVVVYVDISKNIGAFNSPARLDNYFDILLKDQYGKDMTKRFHSLSKECRVVVIDNYNHLFERESNVELLHSFVKDKFGKTFIFSNSKAGISGYLKVDKFLINFNRYNIEIFGPKLQMKIIENWNKLENIEDSDEDLKRKNREDASVVKTLLLGNNLPQTPDAILTILSTSQTNKTDKTTLYGHLLTNIISNAMEKSEIDGDSQEETFRILSTFAFRLYSAESRMLDFSELKDVITEDNQEYGLVNSAERLLRQLTQSNILQMENINTNGSKISEIQCKVSFRYSYLYSYFVARYFSKNLSDTEVLIEIDKLLDDINLEDYSRIIINIWYFSNDIVLLEKLDQKIAKTMASYEVFDYKNPPKIIRDLGNHKKDILINLKGIDENVEINQSDLLEREEVAAHNKSNDIQSYNENDKKAIEQKEIIELNTVLNLMSTIGQIIKCYGGSIKVEQKEYLIQKCYELGMRSLSFIFEMLNKQDDFIEYVRDLFASDTSLSHEDAYEEAVKYVSFLLQYSAFANVYRISDALSSVKIAPTLKKYLSSNYSYGMRLVDVAISYLFLNNEKTSTVESLINEAQDDFLTQSVLRIIIWRYYYYNTAKSKPEKDKLLSKLNIKNESRLVITSNQ